MIERIARFICKHFHGSISRPRNGKYFCWRCLREYPVYWTEDRITIEIDELERLYRGKE